MNQIPIRDQNNMIIGYVPADKRLIQSATGLEKVMQMEVYEEIYDPYVRSQFEYIAAQWKVDKQRVNELEKRIEKLESTVANRSKVNTL